MLKALTLTAAVLTASPALALTVAPAPTRDQAQHLKPEQGSGGPDLRDTWAGGGRPMAGANYTGSAPAYRDAQTFSFGGVTTTMRVETGADRNWIGRPDSRWIGARDSFPVPGYLDRRR